MTWVIYIRVHVCLTIMHHFEQFPLFNAYIHVSVGVLDLCDISIVELPWVKRTVMNLSRLCLHSAYAHMQSISNCTTIGVQRLYNISLSKWNECMMTHDSLWKTVCCNSTSRIHWKSGLNECEHAKRHKVWEITANVYV